MAREEQASAWTAAGFAAEERRGLQLAIQGRMVALIAVQLWLAAALPERFTLWFHLWLGLLLLLGGLQLWLLRHGRYPGLKFLFATLDSLILAAILLAPNPMLAEAAPPALVLRYANIVFAFVLLAGAALSYSPALVLWSGVTTTLAWAAGVWWLTSLPGTFTSADPAWQNTATMVETVRLFLNPGFIHLNVQAKTLFAVLLVAGLLAVVVARARRLVRRSVEAARARTNLARYFSPNLVDALAAQDQPFGAVRRQPVAVLFADLRGFTALCEELAPEAVIDLLRGFHQRMEAAVFACQGTLDKYVGDGLMATFGTPNPGAEDARNALACARRMLAELAAMNQERAAAGAPALRLGIGIHYGPVVQGDIGGERRLEFTVLGDTVNVAARLEDLTRELGTPLAVSDALVAQLAAEGAPRALLADMVAGAPRALRGRAGQLGIWTLGPTAPAAGPCVTARPAVAPPPTGGASA